MNVFYTTILPLLSVVLGFGVPLAVVVTVIIFLKKQTDYQKEILVELKKLNKDKERNENV